MKKYLLLAVLALASLFLASGPAIAQENGNGEEGMKELIHILPTGNVLVRGLKVTSISGNTINASVGWGSFTMNWVVNTDDQTRFYHRQGAPSSFSEVTVNDIISVSGSLVTTAPHATVKAKVVKNWSIHHETVRGNISSTNAQNRSFVVATNSGKNMTVLVTNSTKIMDGNETIQFSDLAVNDRVTVTGVMNETASSFTARTIQVQRERYFDNRKVLEGKLKSLAGTTPPTSFVLTVGREDFTVNVATNTSILRANWTRASLSQFTVGDKVRVYGVVSGRTIDATVVRNVSLR